MTSRVPAAGAAVSGCCWSEEGQRTIRRRWVRGETGVTTPLSCKTSDQGVGSLKTEAKRQQGLDEFKVLSVLWSVRFSYLEELSQDQQISGKKQPKTQDSFFKNTQNTFIASYKHNDRHLQGILVHIYTYFLFSFLELKLP